MGKAKTSRKRKAFSIDDLQPVKIKSGIKTKQHDPDVNLQDSAFIKAAIMDAMVDGDFAAVKSILKSHYDSTNIEKSLAKIKLSRRTFYEALSDKGNPTATTLVKLVSGIAKKAG